MSVTIQVKRNSNTDAGALAVGEFGFHDLAAGSLFIGSSTGNQQIAMKAYVDSVAQGLHPIGDVVAATTEALAACTYDNGTAGVGATLTEDAANGALAAIDGVTLTLNQRVLVKDQADTFENGVYQLSQVGTGAAKWILTRVTDMDVADEIAGTFVFVSGGTLYADTGWVCTSEPEAVTLGTSAITFGQFSAAGQITAGTGLTKTGNTLSVDFGIADTKAVKVDSASVADDEYARFTANGLESRSVSELKSDIGLGNVTNIKNKLDATTAPSATDDDDPGGYSVGSLWLDVTADKAYICLDNSAGAAVWKEISPTAGSGANVGLSNLDTVAINEALKPGTAAALDIGSTTKPWKDIWLAGGSGTPGTNQFKITGTSTSGVRTITLPDLSGTVLTDASTIDGGTWGA